jgi:CheY-like chemotaxis protein
MIKILIIEDNDMNRDMLTHRLQRYGFAAASPSMARTASAVAPDIVT